MGWLNGPTRLRATGPHQRPCLATPSSSDPSRLPWPGGVGAGPSCNVEGRAIGPSGRVGLPHLALHPRHAGLQQQLHDVMVPERHGLGTAEQYPVGGLVGIESVGQNGGLRIFWAGLQVRSGATYCGFGWLWVAASPTACRVAMLWEPRSVLSGTHLVQVPLGGSNGTRLMGLRGAPPSHHPWGCPECHT